MKRILSVILSCALLLSGCSLLRKPHNLSNEAYDLGMMILSFADSYLSGNSTAEAAASQIQGQVGQIGVIRQYEWMEDDILKEACNLLYLSLMEASTEGDDPNKDAVISARNYVAELLGEKDWNG